MRIYKDFLVKILFICVLSFMLSMSAKAQIYYSYDSNGNRLLRSITLKKNAVVGDSVYKEELKKEIFKEDLGETQISIYPNPTHGDLVIDVTGLLDEIPIEYSVYTSSGTLLKKQKLSEHKLNIDFNNYPSGIYVLKLRLEGKVSEWKIIKE